ncbi:glycosyltransferase [Brevibacterium salitolerans]|uniref:Glycosyl transferases group 1 n=1 Tax=Brevibacterium salitolerans TaxID=1403566 RepID=A0ABN2WLU7_9MICO
MRRLRRPGAAAGGGRTPQDRLWQAVEHQLLARTSAVITLNSDDEAWFRQRMPPHAVERIRAGVGLGLSRYPRTTPPDGPLRLAWIGEHTARTCPHFAVAAAAELHRAGLGFSLTMIGVGERLERTRREAARRGLEGVVHVAGWGDARQALAGAHALVHTAQWEGLPRVMLEAFAVGQRSYAFDVQGVRDAPGAVLAADGDVPALVRVVRTGWESGGCTVRSRRIRSSSTARRRSGGSSCSCSARSCRQERGWEPRTGGQPQDAGGAGAPGRAADRSTAVSDDALLPGAKRVMA